jgi:hypothetical protein
MENEKDLVDEKIVEELSDEDLSESSVDDGSLEKPADNPPTFDMTEEVEQMMKKVMRDILLSGNTDTENPDFRKIVFTSVDEEPKKSVWVYPGTKVNLKYPFSFFSLLFSICK